MVPSTVALLPPTAASALEPLFTASLEHVTTARAAEPATHFALKAAAIAGVPAAASEPEMADASVQCSFPWSGQLKCIAAASKPTGSTAKTEPAVQQQRRAADYLAPPMVQQLEQLMDAALLRVSASAREATPQQAPSTTTDWQRLAATHLVRLTPGLVTLDEAPAGRQDAGTQRVSAFTSHSLVIAKPPSAPPDIQ